MATTRTLTLKFGHVSGDTTTINFANISIAGAATLKSKVKAINSGTVQLDGTQMRVNYQPYLLSRAGSPAVKIDSASFTIVETQRVYTQGQGD